MLTIIGQDIISGNMGYIGTEPGRLYRMGPRSKVAEASGEPPVVLTDCKKKPLKGLRIYGKSKQVTTTGAQLLDISKWTTYDTTYGLTMSIQDDIVRLKGIFQKDEVGKRTNAMFRFIKTSPGTVFPENVKFTAEIVNNTGTDGIYFTLTGLKENKPCIVISLFATCGDEVDIQLRPMLYVGDPVPKYEMYTGGQPSPSPDYPQEIESVGQDGEIGVEVYGRNLFDKSAAHNFTKSGGWSAGLEGEEIKVLADNTTIGSIALFRCEKTLPAGTYTFSISKPLPFRIRIDNYIAIKKGDTSATATFNNDISITHFAGDVEPGTSFNELRFKIMLNIGSTALPYEPYHAQQSMSISTPNGLPGIPVPSGSNYTAADGQQWICDEIDFGRGVYVQRIAKEVLNGTERVKWISQIGDVVRFSIETKYHVFHNYDADSSRKGLNGFFSHGTYYTNYSLNDIHGYADDENMYIFLPIDILGNNAGSIAAYIMEQHENGSPLTMYYIVATPIETPLTSDQLAAYKQLHTYKGTTIIDNDAGAYMSVKYNT